MIGGTGHPLMGMADEIEAAEEVADVLAEGLRTLVGVIEQHDTEHAFALPLALVAARHALSAWANYCRPTCRFRTRGECQDPAPLLRLPVHRRPGRCNGVR